MKILLPVDGSSCALRAVESLQKLQGELAAPPEIHLLQVHLPIPVGRVQAHVGYDTLKGYYREESEAQLAEAERILHAAGLAFTSHIHVGQPAEVIVNVARELEVGLIVMGSHGRGAMGTLVLGSVSSKVVHLAPCPVMLIK